MHIKHVRAYTGGLSWGQGFIASDTYFQICDTGKVLLGRFCTEACRFEPPCSRGCGSARAAQPSSRPGWLRALALLRLREGGDGGSYCLGCEKGCAGLVWLVLPVRVGLAWGLPMGAARDEFLGAEVPNGERSSSKCWG